MTKKHPNLCGQENPRSVLSEWKIHSPFDNSQGKWTIGNIAMVAGGILLLTLVLGVARVHWQNVAERSLLKKNGRAIWLAIAHASSEGEYPGPDPLFPADIEMSLKKAFDSAEAYFVYLMSDGMYNGIQRNPEDRIISDLNPNMLVSKGMKPATGQDLPTEANVWHVTYVSITNNWEIPFLITRNVRVVDIRFPTKIELNNPNDTGVCLGMKEDIKPLGAKRVIWVTKGGIVFDEKAKKVTHARICPVLKSEDAPELKVLPAKGGYF